LLNLKEETVPDTELSHLIKLLDDEDEGIYSNIRERFLSYGDLSSNFLKDFAEDENVLLRKRVNEIISTINIDRLEKKFIELSSKKDILEEAVFLIAEFGYPGYYKQKYKDKLNFMAEDIRKNLIKINPDINSLSAISKLNAINAYLFGEKGFAGNKDDFFDTDNSYINRVIDTGLGIPVTLSAVYIFIARRLNMPVFGINLPGHFIIKYMDETDEFFIDPFNQGIIVSRPEATEFIKNLGMTDEEFEKIPYLNIAEDKDIVLRMLRNLSDIYKKKKDEVKAGQIERLMLSLV
jgi:regulator of sirC expression with transglutaminase-like and TPR domain